MTGATADGMGRSDTENTAGTAGSTPLAVPQPGWYPDPSQRFEWRKWDGTSWTDEVALRGRSFRDPAAVADADRADRLRALTISVRRRQERIEQQVEVALTQQAQNLSEDRTILWLSAAMTFGSLGGCLTIVAGVFLVLFIAGTIATEPGVGIPLLVIGAVALLAARARWRRRRQAQHWYQQHLREALAFDFAAQGFTDPSGAAPFRAAAAVLHDRTTRLMAAYRTPPAPRLLASQVERELAALNALAGVCIDAATVPDERLDEVDVDMAARMRACQQVFSTRAAALQGKQAE